MQRLNPVDWRAAAPRVVADLLIVHAAALLSLAISVIYQTAAGAEQTAIIEGFRAYYAYYFAPLSLLFPAVFFLNGLYGPVRMLAWRAKFKRVATVVALATAVFVTADFLLVGWGDRALARSSVLPFALLALSGLLGVRAGKEWLAGSDKRANASAGNGPVLVIGGAGYIGSWLVRRLLQEGHRVRVLDSAVYGVEPIADLIGNPKLEYIEGDCRNIQDVVRGIKGASQVVHLAAIVGDPACEIDRNTTLEINYAATRMLAEICKGYGIERFLFASSCSVYGMTDDVMNESSPVEPISTYASTKVDSEKALLEARSETFHPVLMRFATVFGLSGRPRFDLVVNLLAAKAHEEGVITVYNGEQWRPFVHVKDLAEAMIVLLAAPVDKVSGQVFNVGDNDLNFTLTQVAEAVREVFPDTRIEHIENADKRNYKVNFDKIVHATGFRCSRSLLSGIREIRDAFTAGEIASYKEKRFSNVGFLREAGTPQNKSELDGRVMAAFARSDA